MRLEPSVLEQGDNGTLRIEGVAGFEALQGTQLPPSPWLDVTPQRVDAFAACTQDRQLIHLDAEIARAHGFQGRIAHGLLTLSMLPALWRSTIRIEQLRTAVNYGFNRVRFPSPLIVPGRIRGIFKIAGVERKSDGCLVTLEATIQSPTATKPVCSAELIVRYFA